MIEGGGGTAVKRPLEHELREEACFRAMVEVVFRVAVPKTNARDKMPETKEEMGEFK